MSQTLGATTFEPFFSIFYHLSLSLSDALMLGLLTEHKGSNPLSIRLSASLSFSPLLHSSFWSLHSSHLICSGLFFISLLLIILILHTDTRLFWIILKVLLIISILFIFFPSVFFFSLSLYVIYNVYYTALSTLQILPVKVLFFSPPMVSPTVPASSLSLFQLVGFWFHQKD